MRLHKKFYMDNMDGHDKMDCDLRRSPVPFSALFILSVICSLDIYYPDLFQGVSELKQVLPWIYSRRAVDE